MRIPKIVLTEDRWKGPFDSKDGEIFTVFAVNKYTIEFPVLDKFYISFILHNDDKENNIEYYIKDKKLYLMEKCLKKYPEKLFRFEKLEKRPSYCNYTEYRICLSILDFSFQDL